MSRKNSLVYILSGVILFLVVSCVPAPAPVVPTQQQPVSTSNPNVFSTMVAGTAAAFMTQTVAAMPSPTATPPTTTKTPTPTVTATPTDANENTSLSEMEDGSIQFFDYQAGVKLTVPAGWLTVRLNDLEYSEVLDAAEDDPVLQYGLEGIQELDPDKYRLHAFNTQEDYAYEGIGSQINVIFFKDDDRSLEQMLEDEGPHPTFVDYEFISSGQQIRLDAIELFTREEQWKATSSTDAMVTVYYKGVFFETPSGTILIELFAPLEIKDDIVSEFDQLIEQMSIFTP